MSYQRHLEPLPRSWRHLEPLPRSCRYLTTQIIQARFEPQTLFRQKIEIGIGPSLSALAIIFDLNIRMSYPNIQVVKKTIHRPQDIAEIKKRLREFPVVAILGPRQCGKTTLVREFFHSENVFDLENPIDLTRLENPLLALQQLRGLIVIDEIQRLPNLFPLLRYLVDTGKRQTFLILGSASRELIRQSSETLAGRIAYYEMSGFDLSELTGRPYRAHWLRGGFPRSFLSTTNRMSLLWRANYITTYLEQDIPQLGIQVPARTLRRFWTMLAHYHGQTVNYSEIGRAFGISDKTVRHYLEILEGTFMIRLLQPWHVNVGKRLVKSPKLFFRDSGILHSLLALSNQREVESHPKLGASWEGFVIENVCRRLSRADISPYFWATQAGAELDLFWQKSGKSYGIEVKYSDAPKLTESMRSSLKDLKLKHIWVIYPGTQRYSLHDHVTVVPMSELNSLPI